MPLKGLPQRELGTMSSVHVDRSPNACMALLLSLQEWPKWRQGLTGISNVSDEPMLMAGAWLETWKLGLKTLKMAARVIEVHAPLDFIYVASGDGLATRTAWHLRPSGRGTHISQTIHAEATGLLGWWGDLPKAWLDHNLHSLQTMPRFPGEEIAEASQ